MTIWLPTLTPGHAPAYLAIAEAIARDVRLGRLRPGDRLPPQRLLADLLGLHLSTVTRAYREAARRGLITGQSRRGTLVLDRPGAALLFEPDRATPNRIDLTTNMPACDPADQDLTQLLASVIEEQAVEGLMRYRSIHDWRHYRADCAPWLVRCGLDPERVSLMLCAGAQHALSEALTLLGARTVAVECFTYPGMKALAAAGGLTLYPLAMDREGVLPASLEAAARSGVRIALLSPTLHNPTGASMGHSRRAQIAALAARYRLWLIEEDVYGRLAPQALPPLASLLPERCLYITGLSKTVAPGLRLGLLALPPALARAAGERLHQSSWYLSPLCLELACRLILGGGAERRLLWQRRELAARNRCYDRALGLPEMASTSPHRWQLLPATMMAEDARRHLAGNGVLTVVSGDFAVGAQAAQVQALRLSLGAAASRAAVAQAGHAVALRLEAAGG